MASTSGKLPADCHVVGSSARDVATEVSHINFANDYIFSFNHLATHLSSSTCSPSQITHEMASSSTSAEVDADRNVVVSSKADTAAEVSHIFLQMISLFLINFLLSPLLHYLYSYPDNTWNS